MAERAKTRRWREVDEVNSDPDYIDADCTGRDIVHVLSSLKFTNGKAVVEMDKHAARYIVSAVTARCGK